MIIENTTDYRISITTKEREILRELAKKMVSISAMPCQEEKRRLWYRLNSLESIRPLIACTPENGWNEIITQADLQCEGNLAREWETYLRQQIFIGESMGSDEPVHSEFQISSSLYPDDWGMSPVRKGGENGGAYVWEAPLKDYNDMNKLYFAEAKIDLGKEDALVNAANELFGDLMKVQLNRIWWWSLGLTTSLVELRGLEQIMMDVYDYPDELHQIMAFLRDGRLKMLDELEESGLLTLNNNTGVASGGFGYSNELPQADYSGKVRLKDLWGFAESQETVQISPKMFEEFIFPYQLPVLERFGMNCYGCCEPVERRWGAIKNIPRLRRISVSPWADLRAMAEHLKGDYIYSMKPAPSYLAVPYMDEEVVRKNLREAFKTTRDCRVEVIMKDNHTIGKNPRNVIRWCQIAREEAEAL